MSLPHQLPNAVVPQDAVLPADASPIDATILNEYRDMAGDGASAFLATLIDEYLADAPSLMTRIKDAVERADLPALKLAAHSLKGSSRTIGARRLADLAEAMEAIARNATCVGAAPLIIALDAELERVQPALRVEQARPVSRRAAC